MPSKIKKLIKMYKRKIDVISKELWEYAQNNNHDAYMALVKEKGFYIDIIVDLEDILR